MMQSVLPETYRACFAFGLMVGARKVIPERDTKLMGYGVDGGESSTRVEEWHAGGEVVARKVLTPTSSAYWVRADLAQAALGRIADEESEWERARLRVVDEITAMDEANAARRGMPLEEYRRVRNRQGEEMNRRRGVNSYGIR